MMTLMLDLTPEEEARLAAQAHARGVDIPGLLRTLIANLPPMPSQIQRLIAMEWDALEADLIEGIDPSLPPLSDESLSRASLYGERA